MGYYAPPPIWNVVEEHLAEAGFLWAQREGALVSPRHTIAEVAAGPEERLAAHLEGVAIAGAAADEALLAPALAGGDAGLAAAAAAVLAAAGRLDPVRAALPAAPDGGRALAGALGLALAPAGVAAVSAWLSDPAPAVQAVAVRALGARRAAPAAEVRALLASGDASVRAAALGAAHVLGDAARPAIDAGLADADPAVRDAAIEAGLRLGLRAAWATCQRAADAGAATPLVLEVLAASGDAADVERIAAAAEQPALRRAALFAAGLSGTLRGADVCAAWLGDPASLRTAAEGLGAVAGLAVAGPFEAAEPDPADALPDLEAEDLDAPALPAEDSALPYPDVERLAAAWRERRGALAAGGRWLLGRPWTAPDALAAVRSGPARRRHALARELAIRTRGGWQLDTRAWARDQLRAQAAPLPAGGDPGLPFAKLLRA
jgi:uncharacterized protein (TIGR02270 family)